MGKKIRFYWGVYRINDKCSLTGVYPKRGEARLIKRTLERRLSRPHYCIVKVRVVPLEKLLVVRV